MNIWDALIIALIVLAAALAVAVIIRNKKRGKGCCGDCSRCGGCACPSGKRDSSGSRK